MKTLIQIKDDIARSEGYTDWKDFFNDLKSNNMVNMLASKIDTAAERYAAQYRIEFNTFRENPPAIGELILAYSPTKKKAVVFPFDGKISVEYSHWTSGHHLPK